MYIIESAGQLEQIPSPFLTLNKQGATFLLHATEQGLKFDLIWPAGARLHTAGLS